MNLKLVTGTPFTITCINCGKHTISNDGKWYADLEGKPFKDYYCNDYKNKIEAKK